MNDLWYRFHCWINGYAWRIGGNPNLLGVGMSRWDTLRGRILWALNDFAFRRWYPR
jgi:hypothetical protein